MAAERISKYDVERRTGAMTIACEICRKFDMADDAEYFAYLIGPALVATQCMECFEDMKAAEKAHQGRKTKRDTRVEVA